MDLEGCIPLIFCPSTSICPDVGASSPAIIFKRVDLPQPDSPRIITKSPLSIEKEISLSTIKSAPVGFL